MHRELERPGSLTYQLINLGQILRYFETFPSFIKQALKTMPTSQVGFLFFSFSFSLTACESTLWTSEQALHLTVDTIVTICFLRRRMPRNW